MGETMSHEHLTEQEVNDLVAKDSPSDEQLGRIDECQLCSRSFSEAKALFEQIRQESKAEPSSDLWLRIEYQQKARLADRRSNRTIVSLLSIAASLLVIVGLQWNALNSDQSIQNQINAMMLKSQQFERELQVEQQNLAIQASDFSNSLSELFEIDQALQIAYQENQSDEAILSLWERRVNSLQKILEATSTPANLEII
jgi:hypothetical protein